MGQETPEAAQISRNAIAYASTSHGEWFWGCRVGRVEQALKRAMSTRRKIDKRSSMRRRTGCTRSNQHRRSRSHDLREARQLEAIEKLLEDLSHRTQQRLRGSRLAHVAS